MAGGDVKEGTSSPRTVVVERSFWWRRDPEADEDELPRVGT